MNDKATNIPETELDYERKESYAQGWNDGAREQRIKTLDEVIEMLENAKMKYNPNVYHAVSSVSGAKLYLAEEIEVHNRALDLAKQVVTESFQKLKE